MKFYSNSFNQKSPFTGAKLFTMKRTFLILAAALISLNTFAQEIDNQVNTEVPIEANENKKTKKEKEVIPPMFDLISSGDLTAVKKLKRDSIDYYRHNSEGETMLTLAIKNEDIDMVKLLVEDAVINMKNEEGETPLTLAIKQQNPEIIKLVVVSFVYCNRKQ